MATKKPTLPSPVLLPCEPLQINDAGRWLILSDLHIPYHDKAAVEAAVKYGKKQKIVGVILNGDILDCHEISRWDKDPNAPRYMEERRIGMEFLEWLRAQFPKARIIYRAGNHEDRLEAYLVQRSPALFGLEFLTWECILHLEDYAVEYLGDKRILRMGKLNLLHGHELRPQINTSVNPARGLFLRTKTTAACGHNHATSEHHEKTLLGKPLGCWSIACLCQLHPKYMPINNWNHGAAVVELDESGDFHMDNFRIRDGRIL